MLITKADGSMEVFDTQKLINSLRRAGASEEISHKITEQTKSKLSERMTTREIYRIAFSLLKRTGKVQAARYSIRRALLELGPSGFPFESFVAEIFSAKGFITITGIVVDGKCATHEVDVLAHKKDVCIAIEAKFHNRLGTKSDLKDALYIKSRVDDLKGAKPNDVSGCVFTDGLLVTNTKFTKNARDYATCVGLSIISWNHPKDGSLHDLIRETEVYPVTCLTTLTKSEKQRLIEDHVALCRYIPGHEEVLEKAGVNPSKIPSVIKESQELCSESTHVE